MSAVKCTELAARTHSAEPAQQRARCSADHDGHDPVAEAGDGHRLTFSGGAQGGPGDEFRRELGESGEIVEVNEALAEDPHPINEDPYGEGWMVKVRLSDPSEPDALMDADSYKATLGG